MGNGGIAVLCSQCDQSKRPAHRYSASSLYAVLLHTSRSDRTAWTVRMNISGSAGSGGVLLMPRPAVDFALSVSLAAGREGDGGAGRAGVWGPTVTWAGEVTTV